MINITIEPGFGNSPNIKITHHATGEELTKVFPLYRTRMTGRWAGPGGTPYATPEDRQHFLNEAQQFAQGFADGVRYALSSITRINDKTARYYI